MDAQVIHWLGFHILVLFLLLLDLGVFHRHHRVIELKKAAGWSFFGSLSLCFLTSISMLNWDVSQRLSLEQYLYFLDEFFLF